MMADQALPEQLRLGRWRSPDATKGVRLRNAADLGVTERSAYGIVTDLARGRLGR
jgi:hypothetical protein